MESKVNLILSNYFSDYLEIKRENINTNILKGTIDLYTVKFKKNIFNILNFPSLELIDGIIYKIHIQLILPDYYLHPINIEIDKIFIKIKTKSFKNYNKEAIVKNFELYKKKKLNQFEEIMKNKFSLILKEEENKNKKNYKTKAENKIKITNINLKINNILLIFDDFISNPDYPITLGIIINGIFIDSTSKDFTKIKKEDKLSNLKYKKICIDNLNMFLDNIKKENIILDENNEKCSNLIIDEEIKKSLKEKEIKYLGNNLNFYLHCESEIQLIYKQKNYHNYLLSELNSEIRLIINEKFYENTNKAPQINGFVDLKSIFLKLTHNQIRALSDSINYINSKNLYQKKTIDEYFNSIEKIDNDLIQKYLEEYICYCKIKYIVCEKNEKEIKKYLINLEDIEKNLRINSIITLRQMGNDMINNLVQIEILNKKIKNVKGSFFGIFRSKRDKEIKELNLEIEKKIKEQKELMEKNCTLNCFKNYNINLLKAEKYKYKEDQDKFILRFFVEQLKILIQEEIPEKEKILEINLIEFDTQMIIKNIGIFIKTSLQDIKFKNILSQNINYKKLLYSEDFNQNKNTSLILIEFEYNKLFEISPFKVKLNIGKNIFSIIDNYYLYYLYKLFLNHINTIEQNKISSYNIKHNNENENQKESEMYNKIKNLEMINNKIEMETDKNLCNRNLINKSKQETKEKNILMEKNKKEILNLNNEIIKLNKLLVVKYKEIEDTNIINYKDNDINKNDNKTNELNYENDILLDSNLINKEKEKQNQLINIKEKIKELNNLNEILIKEKENNIKIREMIKKLNKKIDEEKNKNKIIIEEKDKKIKELNIRLNKLESQNEQLKILFKKIKYEKENKYKLNIQLNKNYENYLDIKNINLNNNEENEEVKINPIDNNKFDIQDINEFFISFQNLEINYENELNKNKELINKLNYQNDQIEGLKIFIHKITNEKENLLTKEINKKIRNSKNKIEQSNENRFKNELKNSKLIKRNFQENINKLEEKKENKSTCFENKSKEEKENYITKLINENRIEIQKEDTGLDDIN